MFKDSSFSIGKVLKVRRHYNSMHGLSFVLNKQANLYLYRNSNRLCLWLLNVNFFMDDLRTIWRELLSIEYKKKEYYIMDIPCKDLLIRNFCFYGFESLNSQIFKIMIFRIFFWKNFWSYVRGIWECIVIYKSVRRKYISKNSIKCVVMC